MKNLGYGKIIATRTTRRMPTPPAKLSAQGMARPDWYRPTDRGLEARIAEGLPS
jgi:hypothetical protein